MKPKALTIGTISRVPRVTANAFEASRRRQMATPVSSSPCRAALTNRVGPSRLPWMTETGSAIGVRLAKRSEEHTSELQSLMRSSYAVFCLKKKKIKNKSTQQSHKHGITERECHNKD